MVQMNHLKKEYQLKSSDPEYWDIWTGEIKRSADWTAIADDWQQINHVAIATEPFDAGSDDGDIIDNTDDDRLPF